MKQATLMVPKKFSRMERKTDSGGNEQQYFYYPGGAQLYFVHTNDSVQELQPINYEENIPRQLYGWQYYKGIDNTNRYWRENRHASFRTGYRYVHPGNDGKFDSSLNYFTLHIK